MSHCLADALAIVNQRIEAAMLQFQRSPNSVQLLAVTKGQSAATILQAWQLGQRQFGESYVQEALPKLEVLNAYPIVWHFIGPLQTNKLRWIAEHFAWVHSLDSLKHAQRLSAQRPAELPALNVCIQVNVSREPQKAGITEAEALELIPQIKKLPRLQLRGLMTLPAYTDDFEQQRQSFRQLAEFCKYLGTLGHALDTLSMGMTDDLEAAIAEGSTLVRVGTALFGQRN